MFFSARRFLETVPAQGRVISKKDKTIVTVRRWLPSAENDMVCVLYGDW